MECAHTMLRAKSLPKNLWAKAVSTAVYVLNRTTHSNRSNVKTPFEIWNERKPDLKHIRIFESTAYIHVPKQLRKKLDDKAKKMLLVGY
ncbi:Copia protein [Ooceraea biroi]|uniref:Copia protein n=1 Tax=Ooceraea biroi TaxID=2015173 RepID=A0A026X1Q4_OOCBI|nr:Copia protein [Ooceraea biroi]